MAIHLKLVVLALCVAALTVPCSGEEAKKPIVVAAKEAAPKEPAAKEAAKEILKEAESGGTRVVKQVNQVNEDNSYTVGYEADDGSFKIETRDASGHIKERGRPVAQAQTQRRVPSLRQRRPQDSESPEDPTPVLSMLLRRSRQGVHSASQGTRSDADELLRIQHLQQQQQTDGADVYGPGAYQHLMRGRVQGAVLRQLTPGQLHELQQYVTPEARRALNPSLRALMTPVLDYLATRDQPDLLPTPYADPYLPYYPQQQYYQRPYAPQYYQPPPVAPQLGLYDELRQALIQRMLLAARLLGVEGMLGGRYALDADQYGDRLLGQRFYTQPDPRLSHHVRSLPYQHALQLARETHERQLAAYQANIAARREPTEAAFAAFGGPDAEYGDYSTPSSVVRAGSSTQRPSNIQRVRNVQVLTPTPSATTTASPSPTTPRRY